MKRSIIDVWVGIFVAVGFGGLLFLALKVGNLASFSTAEAYQIQAKFANIGGWVRAPGKSAGLFGYVCRMSLSATKATSPVRSRGCAVQVSARYFREEPHQDCGRAVRGAEEAGMGLCLKQGTGCGDNIGRVRENLISQFLFNRRPKARTASDPTHTRTCSCVLLAGAAAVCYDRADSRDRTRGHAR